MINDLQDKDHESSINCVSPSDWLEHFKNLNQVQEKFLDRIKFLEEKLKISECSLCFNELDFAITDEEITTAISKLKNDKSPGLDNITNNMIKCSQNSLLLCYKKIFNACLATGIYPVAWAEGYVVPLHKSNDVYDPNNYRGLTITSSIGKLFNSVLNSRLDKFLAKNKIIDDCQIGFTKKARTSDHMFVLKTIIDKYCNAPCGRLFACFVDFRKAFDTVIHTGIKLKLLEIGVGTLFYKIIKNMYAVSKSCIKINNELTDDFQACLGVKQGDNLSPNLFKIFINDISAYLKDSIDPVYLNGRPVHCLMYADDIVILSTTPGGLQNKLDILQQYCSDYCLSVNPNKTKILIFNKAGKLITQDFLFGNTKLECVDRYKYLGIYFCASGSFSLAQEELYKKAIKAYFKLSKDFLSLGPSIKTSLHVFDHTIKPILLYGCEIWGTFNPLSSKFRNGIDSFEHIYSKLIAEKLHLKFCKFILGTHSKTTNFAVLSELGRFPLTFNIIKAMLKFYYRAGKCETSFPLLFDAFSESKILAEMKKPSWYISIQKLIEKIKSYQPTLKDGTIISDAILKKSFLEEWKKSHDNHFDGKLSSYIIFKNNFGYEIYLSIINKFDLRRSLTRLRLSAHQLLIEKGRYIGIPRHNRICPRCTSNEVEDEIHFLFNCTALEDNRKTLHCKIDQNCKNFKNLDSKSKLIWLMNNEDKDTLLELCLYIKKNEKHPTVAAGTSD